MKLTNDDMYLLRLITLRIRDYNKNVTALFLSQETGYSQDFIKESFQRLSKAELVILRNKGTVYGALTERKRKYKPVPEKVTQQVPEQVLTATLYDDDLPPW